MASLKKFTRHDPKARVNLSLPESVRTALEEYSLFYASVHGDETERSELVEQLLIGWFDQDRDFQKFREGLTAAQKATVRKAVASATAAPTAVPARPPGVGVGQP